MGKRIIPQRRGRGSPRYRSRTRRSKGRVSYPPHLKKGKVSGGQVTEITHDRIRSAPVAKILLDDYTEMLIIAPEGLSRGQWINIGGEGKSTPGSILPIGNIPEGTDIYNIELNPGDGGKIVRSAGSAASVISHEKASNITYIKLPSKKAITVNNNAMATVGKIAGGGRKEKPLVRAGQRFHSKKAVGKLYPKVCGRAMNAIDHPHGGGRHPHVGKPTTVSRNTPPGRKVGHIAAKRTGRKR